VSLAAKSWRWTFSSQTRPERAVGEVRVRDTQTRLIALLFSALFSPSSFSDFASRVAFDVFFPLLTRFRLLSWVSNEQAVRSSSIGICSASQVFFLCFYHSDEFSLVERIFWENESSWGGKNLRDNWNLTSENLASSKGLLSGNCLVDRDSYIKDAKFNWVWLKNSA
jgi:hypothetical protein